MASVKAIPHPLHPEDLLIIEIKYGNTVTTVCLMFNEADKLASDIRKWQGRDS